MPSFQQTLEQERAASAWDDVQEVIGKAQSIGQAVERERLDKGDSSEEAQTKGQTASDGFKKTYRALTRNMSALVVTAGLGQALAFLRAKSGNKSESKEQTWLYRHVSAWVLKRLHPDETARNSLVEWLLKRPGQSDRGQAEQVVWEYLLEWLLDQSSDVYRRATTETLAYLNWLKRFAEAELPEPEGEEV